MKQKKTKLSVTAIERDLTFSDKSVWLWVKVPPTPYEFLDADTRESAATSMDIALSTLLTSDEKPLECQLIVTNSPFDSVAWVNDLYERSLQDNPPDHLVSLLNEMENRVNGIGFRDKKVYLGIKLGARGEFANNKSVIPLEELMNFVTPLFGVKDYTISDKELAFWEQKSKLFRRSLILGHLKAEQVYAEELAYLIKKPFFPAMETPPVDVSARESWGVGELDYLTDGRIENRAKYLKISQEINGEEKVGYRTTLAFARFPDTLYYPQQEPWIHFSSSLGFPVDFYSRFTLEPVRKVRKEIGQKLKEVKDQAENMTSAGGSMNIDIQERLHQGENLDYALSQATQPWVYARHRITVEADNEQELKERVQQVTDHYKDLNIQVIAPTGDQLSLLLEGMPNDFVRLSSYYQRQELSIISAGTPAGSSLVGSQKKRFDDGEEKGFVGPYIGYTLSRILSPVFFSPHSEIAIGEGGGVAITGSSGSGKSFLAFTATYLMSLMGTWSIYIDPKGEALPLAKLPGLEKTRVFDLLKGKDGILDPFTIGETPAAQKELAYELIIMFMGGQINGEQNVAITEALSAVARRPEPSLTKITQFLLYSKHAEGKNVGTILNLISELDFARLCFSPGNKKDAIDIEEGLTLITFTGLNLPSDELDRSQYETSHKLAVAVMYLLTSYTKTLMFNKNKTHPKAVIIDEAWAITSTPQGLKMCIEIARVGRSRNTALMLVSQNAGDFKGDAIENQISTKIAFKAKTKSEIQKVLESLGLEVNDGNRSVIRNLEQGECIIKDSRNRLAKVKIDNWNTLLNYAVENNPEKIRQREAAERALALAESK